MQDYLTCVHVSAVYQGHREGVSSRGETIMLINLSIIYFSTTWNFAYYAYRFYLLIILKIILDLMLMALQKLIIIITVSGFLLYFFNE